MLDQILGDRPRNGEAIEGGRPAADFVQQNQAARGRGIEDVGGLERDELSRGGRPTLSGAPGDPQTQQLGLFARPSGETNDLLDRSPSPGDDEIQRRLRSVDVDEITPRQALELVAELKKLAEEP